MWLTAGLKSFASSSPKNCYAHQLFALSFAREENRFSFLWNYKILLFPEPKIMCPVA